jgi:short-subunit dehydrogenase
MRNVQDMVVIITGASAGIGKALAEQLSGRGAKLVLAARRVDRLDDLNRALGGRHLTVKADVSSAADCEQLIARASSHFSRIDTLVCNAGYGILRPVAQTSEAEMRAIFQTNVFGTTDCIRAAVPVMAKQEPRDGWRGQIVIVSSAAGRRGLPYFGAYSATKFAQLGLAEALRVELRPQRIAVTSVHPIGTHTDFFTTAEQMSAKKMAPPGVGEVRQTPDVVARKMIRAIQRPRPEVWPFAPARFLVSLGTLMPRVVDRVMSKYRGELDAMNES